MSRVEWTQAAASQPFAFNHVAQGELAQRMHEREGSVQVSRDLVFSNPYLLSSTTAVVASDAGHCKFGTTA